MRSTPAFHESDDAWPDITADADGKAGARHPPGQGGGADGAGQREEALAVFQLHQLPADFARPVKSVIDMPERAAAGDRQRRCTGCKALGHGAGAVHPQEEEGHAARAGAVQGGQPVRHLFQPTPETRLQQFDIIAGCLAGGEEAGIGHQRGGGGIFAHGDRGGAHLERIADASTGDGRGNLRF